MELITTRELASIILLAALLLWTLPRREVRAAFASVGKAFIQKKVLAVFVTYALYIAAWTWVASRVGLWEHSLLKDTVVWFVIAGLPLLLNFDAATTDERFFGRTARSTVALSVFIGFFVNIISFHLAVELVVQAVMAMLAMLIVVAGMEKRHAPVKRLCEMTLAVIGVVLIAYTAVEIFTDWDELDLNQLGRSLALTIWLPLVALPFIYAFALVAGYELAFMRMRFANNRQPPNLKSRLATLFVLSGNVREVQRFAGGWAGRAAAAPSFGAARERMREYRKHRFQERTDQSEREDRLRRFAGVEGTDAEGKRLDQREFEETRDALQWLATCHMGWYRKRGGRYRSDLLEVLGEFSSQGLPEQHGVLMQVSRDGQAWYAWRQTVSGWVLGIGAAAGPPDQWFYDGAGPPAGFPGEAEGWEWFGPGEGSKNW